MPSTGSAARVLDALASEVYANSKYTAVLMNTRSEVGRRGVATRQVALFSDPPLEPRVLSGPVVVTPSLGGTILR